MRHNLDDFMYIKPVNNVDDVLADGNYPASTGYIDVGEYTHFAFLVHAGDNWGVPAFQVYQDTSATETAAIKVVTGAQVTGLATDDDKWFTIEVEVARLDLANGFRYVTLAVSASSSEEADIIFLAWNARREPVTQHANYRTAVVVAG